MTAAVEAFLHSSLWFSGNFPTELINKKKEPPAHLKSRKSFAWETMNFLTMALCQTIFFYAKLHDKRTFTLNFRLCINSDCVVGETLLSKNVGEETVACELLLTTWQG